MEGEVAEGEVEGEVAEGEVAEGEVEGEVTEGEAAAYLHAAWIQRLTHGLCALVSAPRAVEDCAPARGTYKCSRTSRVVSACKPLLARLWGLLTAASLAGPSAALQARVPMPADQSARVLSPFWLAIAIGRFGLFILSPLRLLPVVHLRRCADVSGSVYDPN